VARERGVPLRWRIPARLLELVAADARPARINATRHMHILEGLPPWRPLLRIIYQQTDTTPVDFAERPSARRRSRRRGRAGRERGVRNVTRGG
jgi:hypothetical protein